MNSAHCVAHSAFLLIIIFLLFRFEMNKEGVVAVVPIYYPRGRIRLRRIPIQMNKLIIIYFSKKPWVCIWMNAPHKHTHVIIRNVSVFLYKKLIEEKNSSSFVEMRKKSSSQKKIPTTDCEIKWTRIFRNQNPTKSFTFFNFAFVWTLQTSPGKMITADNRGTMSIVTMRKKYSYLIEIFLHASIF